MTAELERRIAHVIVRAQHPGVPDATIDRLVNDLGVGRSLARLIVGEVQAWQRELSSGLGDPISVGCPTTEIHYQMEADG